MVYSPRFSSNRMGALDFDWHLDEFENLRKSAGVVAFLEATGERLVGQLNTELRAAQAQRGQPQADGYKFYVTGKGEGGDKSRARLHILAFTARGIAHEAKHQSILRLLGEAVAATSQDRADERRALREARTAARREREGGGS
ncbi:hypothetical protein PBI_MALAGASYROSE_17 [Mycobacterium phage MalagasyRose]|uniref:Uncharacterized protein n=1 Tax=Mycobacterium phage MalagasyRose TaxID=2599870 RepID=A0A5J6TGA9_9CAUD|nr:hypothetical protein QEH39_gp71 [Mycobacterium phage MalagasyRose]QFG08867.1 hypothetical protein PBI_MALAGASYROSE_17 [Mycobacterium phage MalagasyRose]